MTTTRTRRGHPAAGRRPRPPRRRSAPASPHAWTVAENAEDLKATWLFGDGTAADGPAASHTFEKPGVFPVAVTLDDGGALDSSRRTEEVYVRVNQAPAAQAGPDRIVCPGDTVAFDAALSADGDGTLTGWRWRFSDGVTLEGAQVERSFSSPGLARVELTVTDDSGSACAIGSDDAAVLVNAPAGGRRRPRPRRRRSARRTTRSSSTPSGASDPDGQGVRVDLGLRRRHDAPPTPPPATATPPPATTPSAPRRATPPASPAASPATRRPCAPTRASDAGSASPTPGQAAGPLPLPPYRAVPGGSRGAGEGPPRAARAPAGNKGARAQAVGASGAEPAHAGERRSKRRFSRSARATTRDTA